VHLQYDDALLAASGVHVVNQSGKPITFGLTVLGVERTKTFPDGTDEAFAFPQRAVSFITNSKGRQGLDLSGLEGFRVVS